MAKNTVKHTIVTGRKYNVYKFEGGSIELLDTVETNGTRPREVELCKKYEVKKVVLEECEKVTKTYELDIDTFMQHASEVVES